MSSSHLPARSHAAVMTSAAGPTAAAFAAAPDARDERPRASAGTAKALLVS